MLCFADARCRRANQPKRGWRATLELSLEDHKTLPLQGSTKMSSRVSAIIFTGLVSSTSIRLMRESTCSSPKNFHTCIFFNILVIGTSAQVRHGSSAGDGICLGNEYFEIGVSQRTSDTGKFHVNTPCSGFYGRRSGLSGWVVHLSSNYDPSQILCYPLVIIFRYSSWII